MSRTYTEAEVVEAVGRLTVVQLRSFIEAEIVTPTQTERGPEFRQVDLARLELLSELAEDFEMHPDALGVVMTLLDQLHGLRASLRSVMDAVAREPDEVRQRILAAIRDTAAPGT